MATKIELISALENDYDYKVLEQQLHGKNMAFSGTTRDIVSYFLTKSQIENNDIDMLVVYVNYCLFVMRIGNMIYEKYKDNKDLKFKEFYYDDAAPHIKLDFMSPRKGRLVECEISFYTQDIYSDEFKDAYTAIMNSNNFSYLYFSIVLSVNSEGRFALDKTSIIKDVSVNEILDLVKNTTDR